MRIMAFDPGGTTGIAVFFANRFMNAGQLGPHPHHVDLYNELEQLQPEVVICERFVHRTTIGVDVTALEYIGVITLWCEQNKVHLRMQTPSAAKAFWTDDKLKHLGLWRKGQRHAVDAIRHALTYIMDNDDFYIRSLSPR